MYLQFVCPKEIFQKIEARADQIAFQLKHISNDFLFPTHKNFFLFGLPFSFAWRREIDIHSFKLISFAFWFRTFAKPRLENGCFNLSRLFVWCFMGLSSFILFETKTHGSYGYQLNRKNSCPLFVWFLQIFSIWKKLINLGGFIDRVFKLLMLVKFFCCNIAARPWNIGHAR